MQMFKCDRCGNTIRIGSYKGEVCPVDQGTLVPISLESLNAKTRTIEHGNAAPTKQKMQVLLNE